MNTFSKLLLFGAFLNTLICFAQPSNDDCANAISIACGDTISGSTTNATLESIPNCGPATVTVGGVWYLFTGTGDAVTVSTCNMATYDSKIGVYDGTCGALNCIAGNDDAAGCSGLSSEVTFNSVAGTDYYIFIHGYGSAFGDFDVAVSCLAPCAPLPANDLCSGATPLTLYGDQSMCVPITGTNDCSSANLANPSCFLFGSVYDVWYSFNTGDVYGINLSFDTITGSQFFYALYDNCGEPNTACSSLNGSGVTNISGLQSNTNYLLQIFNGGGPYFGSFDICISADSTANEPPTPVTNDECDNPIMLTEGNACNYTAASVYGATETIPSDSCNNFFSSAALDVWFSFVCTNPVTTIEVDPMFDPVLQLRDECGGGTILGCSDNVGALDDEYITTSDLVVGSTYYVRVYPFGSSIPADPNFSICVYEGQYVGINELTHENEFKLYPNPTNGNLNIDYNLDVEGSIRIINGIGQIVMSKELTKSVSLNNLDKGIYLVNIIGNEGKVLYMERLVLQ